MCACEHCFANAVVHKTFCSSTIHGGWSEAGNYIRESVSWCFRLPLCDTCYVFMQVYELHQGTQVHHLKYAETEIGDSAPCSTMLQVQCISLPKRFMPSVSECLFFIPLYVFLFFSFLFLHSIIVSLSTTPTRFLNMRSSQAYKLVLTDT